MPLSSTYNEIRQAFGDMEKAVGTLTASHARLETGVVDEVAKLIQSLDALSEGSAEIMASQLKSEAEILASIKANESAIREALLDLARQIQGREKEHSQTIQSSSGASMLSKQMIKLDTTIGALITKTDETLRILNDIQLELTRSAPAAHRMSFLDVTQTAGAVAGLAVGMANMSLTMTNSAAVSRLQKSVATTADSYDEQRNQSQPRRPPPTAMPIASYSFDSIWKKIRKKQQPTVDFMPEEAKPSSQTSNTQSSKSVESHECEANCSGMLGAIQPSLEASQTLVERAFENIMLIAIHKAGSKHASAVPSKVEKKEETHYNHRFGGPRLCWTWWECCQCGGIVNGARRDHSCPECHHTRCRYFCKNL
jgi:rubrerythrin